MQYSLETHKIIAVLQMELLKERKGQFLAGKFVNPEYFLVSR